jgi:hypothetical protein
MSETICEMGEAPWWTVSINGPDEVALRALARQAIRNGRLPRRAPDRTSNGNGVGAPCAICERPITPDHLKYTMQFDRDDPSPGWDRFQLHLRCFAVWEVERTKP